MAGESDPLERAYEPPAEIARPSAAQREPSLPDFRLVRLHLLVLAIAMVILVAVTAGMQLELWDPGPTFTPEVYDHGFTVHGISPFTLLLPLLLGVLPMLVLPGSQMRFPAWVAWPALVMWGVSVVPWWVGIEPLATTLWLALVVVVSGASGLYALGVVLAVIGGGWAVFRRAPVIRIALVLGSVGIVLAMVLLYAPRVLGPIGLAGPDLPDALLLVLMVMAVGLVEQRWGVTISTLRFDVAFATVLVGIWGIYAAQAVLGPAVEVDAVAGLSSLVLVPVLLYLLLRIGRPAIASLPDPAGVAVLLALASLAGMGLTWRFLGILSRDVHLHDTYFVLVPLHLAGTAALLLLVAACLHWSPALFRREPRRALAIAGVLGLGGGMLVSFVTMAVLGQQGMPRRYYTYVPQFQSLHQWIGLGGLVAAMGIVLVFLAFATGRRSAAPAQPEGTAGG
jgi:hypothetical protein